MTRIWFLADYDFRVQTMHTDPLLQVWTPYPGRRAAVLEPVAFRERIRLPEVSPETGFRFAKSARIVDRSTN